MFGTLGGPELFLIFIVALIVFGPRKLPDIGKSLGRMMSEFRRASNEFKSTIESEVESEKIRESMRIEPPKVTKAKASPPGETAKATAAAAGAADGEGKGPTPSPSAPETDSSAGDASPNDAEKPSGEDRAPSKEKKAEAPPPSSDPAGEAEPSTVSRQPPAPESK
jgi:Tat protein translocase TatB subunit